MKNLTKALTLLLSVALLLTACSAPAPSTDSPVDSPVDSAAPSAEPAGDAQGEPIYVGYIDSLTGAGTLWGTNGLRGTEMAAEEINAAGGVLGRQIKVVSMDGKGDPQDCVLAFNKLIDEYNIVACIGTTYSNCNIAMTPIANAKKVPLIGTAASSALVTVDENGNLQPYSFRIGFIDPFQGEVDASLAYKELGLKVAGVLYDVGDSCSTGIAEAFMENFKALGGEVANVEQARTGDNDFRAQLSAIAKANVDVLFLPWNYNDVALIAQQARELGITCTMIGADGWDSAELIQMAPDALEGCYYCARTSFNDPITDDFHAKYVEIYNEEPHSQSLTGYDSLYWLVQCINQTGGLDTEAIRDALENTTHFEGLMGVMSIDPATHNPDRALSIFTGHDGAWEYVKNYTK